MRQYPAVGLTSTSVILGVEVFGGLYRVADHMRRAPPTNLRRVTVHHAADTVARKAEWEAAKEPVVVIVLAEMADLVMQLQNVLEVAAKAPLVGV